MKLIQFSVVTIFLVTSFHSLADTSKTNKDSTMTSINKTIDDFKIIGIGVETSNENNQSMLDLGNLWQRFYSDNVAAQIPNKLSNDVYSIYTDYTTDYTGKYTSIIGLQVSSLESIPAGMVGREFSGGNYQVFTAKGKLPETVITTWEQIWQKDSTLKRRYSTDFEIYTDKSQQDDNSEVDIYIAVE